MFAKVSNSYHDSTVWDPLMTTFSILGPWCSDFNKSWTDIAPQNKKMKQNFHLEISAIHSWSFSFKWMAGRPILVNSLTCSLAMVLNREITSTLTLGFVDCFAKQNTWHILLAEIRGYYGIQKEIPKPQFAPVSRNLF